MIEIMRKIIKIPKHKAAGCPNKFISKETNINLKLNSQLETFLVKVYITPYSIHTPFITV